MRSQFSRIKNDDFNSDDNSEEDIMGGNVNIDEGVMEEDEEVSSDQDYTRIITFARQSAHTLKIKIHSNKQTPTKQQV